MKTPLIVLVSLAALLSTRGFASIVELNEVKKFDRQAYIGSNVELECDLKNFYDSPVLWRKLVGRMSDESEAFEDGRLIIYDLTKEDAGEYECYNPGNGDKRQVRLVVLSQLNSNQQASSEDKTGQVGNLKQIQSKYKHNVDAQVGGSVELYCEFKDETDVEWRKVDGELGPHRTIYGAPDNRLALHFLTEEDEGLYECILADGTASQINLKLTSKKTGVNDDVFKTNTDDYNDEHGENVQTINADYGSDVKLVCNLSEYNNGGEINWRKIAGVIDTENSHIIENRLEIDGVVQDDAGIYECSTENQNSMKFHLIVSSQPTTSRATTTTSTESYDNEDDLQPKTTTPEQNVEFQDDPVDSIVTKPVGSKVELMCALKVPSYDTIDWKRLDDDINYDKTTAYDNKLVIDNLDLNDAGVYECNALETRSAHRTRLEVVQSAPSSNGTVLQTDRRYQYQYCGEDEATCRNGQCIPKSVLCDGRNDCADGSDENNCGSSGSGYLGKCQPNEKPCRTDGKCVPKFWFCDGEKECSDGTDEESCTGPSPGGICKPFEFMCKNRNQCIYKSFLCDNERDCTDGSDETGCVEPKVVQPPIRILTVCLGHTFKLECRAQGFPVPFINWRLNWGHVCPEPRCWMVTDEIGHGTLTVTNAQWEDAGAYSCEAINTKGREFAIPDAIVKIESCAPTPPTTTTTTTTTRRTTTLPPEPLEECECYGHAEACTCSNECYRCQHNTTGPHCEECLPGYFRDHSRPNDLWAYCYQDPYTPPTTPRPIIITTTPIYDDEDCVQTCHNHSECTCNMQCYECRDNTYGDRCQYCKEGFVGDATRGTPDDCVPIGQDYRYPNRLQALIATTRAQEFNVECNEFGTAQVIDGNCKCKPGVVGVNCDQCAPKFFHLVEQKSYRRGCISCFCNGLEVHCESSRLHYASLAAKFDGSEQEQWQISDRFIETKLELEQVDQGVEFARFNEFSELDMYILVPFKFKGNKLGAYGGNLTFDLTVKGESSSDPKQFEIRISGAQVNIIHKSDIPINLNEETKITINLVEDSFKRYGDNGRVDRDHLMIALSDIRIIMIRASYVNNQESIRLSNFSLDVASEDNQEEEGIEAKTVEICRCPEGYTGNSCENCAPGYERTKRGFYLGLCEPI